MVSLPHYNGVCVGIFGLGKTGISLIKLFLRSRAIPFVWDENPSVRQNIHELNLQCYILHPQQWNWSIIHEVILSPGIPIQFPKPHWILQLAKLHQAIIKSDIQIFIQGISLWQSNSLSFSSRPKVIGVTGTNGKSTTSALIAHILNNCGIPAEVGGNIGIPVSDLETGKSVYVLELSSFQLELLDKFLDEFVIDVGVFLNLTPDHLDRHSTIENYQQIKQKLLQRSQLAVVGIATQRMMQIYENLNSNEKLKIPIISANYILPNGISVKSQQLFDYGDKIASLHSLKINVDGNGENIAAAWAVCRHGLQLKAVDILKALETFDGLPHRNQFLCKIRNITFVNDSKSTNAASSEKALLAWRNIYWIIGGRSKSDGIDPIVSQHKTLLQNVTKVFIIGEASTRFAKSLRGIADFVESETLSMAFNNATTQAIHDNNEVTILLSPACASFDQWKNFEHRGNAFTSMVEIFHKESANIPTIKELQH